MAERKTYSAEFKAKVLAEVAKKEMTIPQIAIKFGINNNSSIYTWLGRTGKAKRKIGKGGTNAYPDSLRNAVLADTRAGLLSAPEIAKKHKIHQSSVYTWMRQAKSNVAPEKGNGKDTSYLRDVSTYLRHARADVDGRLKRGEIKHYDQAHLLMLLALSEFEKHGY